MCVSVAVWNCRLPIGHCQRSGCLHSVANGIVASAASYTAVAELYALNDSSAANGRAGIGSGCVRASASRSPRTKQGRQRIGAIQRRKLTLGALRIVHASCSDMFIFATLKGEENVSTDHSLERTAGRPGITRAGRLPDNRQQSCTIHGACRSWALSQLQVTVLRHDVFSSGRAPLLVPLREQRASA